MNTDQAKKVLTLAKEIASASADICKEGDNEINNQVTLSAMMLATCIMGRFFNEDKELMLKLLMAMLLASEEVPCEESFADHKFH